MPATLCTMLPYAIEREPQELLPAMPPMRRLRRRADVDREPQPVRLQTGVQLIEHDAGLAR